MVEGVTVPAVPVTAAEEWTAAEEFLVTAEEWTAAEAFLVTAEEWTVTAEAAVTVLGRSMGVRAAKGEMVEEVKGASVEGVGMEVVASETVEE